MCSGEFLQQSSFFRFSIKLKYLGLVAVIRILHICILMISPSKIGMNNLLLLLWDLSDAVDLLRVAFSLAIRSIINQVVFTLQILLSFSSVILLQCCAITLQFNCNCSQSALLRIVMASCFEIALKLLWNCSGVSGSWHENCSWVALELLLSCSEIAPKLLENWSTTENCHKIAMKLL